MGRYRSAVLAAAMFALSLPLSASAEVDPQVPLILVMSQTTAIGTDMGLIGGIIGNSASKVAAEQAAEFTRRTPGIEWAQLAAEEFSCFAIADRNSGCRKTIVAGSKADVDALLGDQAIQRAIVVELTQTFRNSIRHRARAIIHDMSRRKKGFNADRVFTVLYETILPKPLWNTSVPEADRWWAEGSPSRLEADARRSLQELRELADFVEPLTRDKWSLPREWKQLPRISTLEKTGRAVCAGLPCGDVRIFEERGGRTWLVNDRPLLPIWGPSVASLDENALLNQTNLFILVTQPY